MGAAEIVAYLNHLATVARVSASTQNQALCALVFLYKQVLEQDPSVFDALQRARRPHHLPVVLSPSEVRAVLDRLEHPFDLIAALLYGSGLRLNEALSLRVKDIDFERRQVMIRRGKGAHDRPALLPELIRDRPSGDRRWGQDLATDSRAMTRVLSHVVQILPENGGATIERYSQSPAEIEVWTRWPR